MNGTKKLNSASVLKCICCGEIKKADVAGKTMDDFYRSHSKIYSGCGYIPICKECLEKLYNEYLATYEKELEESNIDNVENYYVEKKAIKRLCMMNNIYYSDKLFEAALKHHNKNTMFSAYMKIANLIQYKKDTYDTTLSDEETVAKQNEIISDYEEGKKLKNINKKTIKFFGTGFEPEDYEFLQEQYSDWTTRHECKTKAQEEVFKQICFTQLELLKATRNKEDTKDLKTTFQKLLETAKLQPKQNSSDVMSDTQTFGTLIDKWENTRPVPDIDDEFKDVDKIGLYIDVFFRGHAAKMLNIKNAFSNLYSKFMKKYTVEKPEYDDEDGSEALFDIIFGQQDMSDE